jgi:hypothetical protein
MLVGDSYMHPHIISIDFKAFIFALSSLCLLSDLTRTETTFSKKSMITGCKHTYVQYNAEMQRHVDIAMCTM